MPSLIFRKGLDLKDAVAGRLAENYHSAIVERIKADDYTYRAGTADDSSRPRVRILLRGRSGGRLRLSDEGALPRSCACT